MKRLHLDLLAPTGNLSAGVLGRRQALSALAIGAVAACSSTTIEPTVSGGDDGGGVGVGGDGGSNPGEDSGTAGADSGVTGGGDASSCSATPAGVDVGDVSTVPVGTWKAAGSRNDPYIVAQDSGGYYAYTAICPHQGCQVDSPTSAGKTTCPCHGAQFDGNGAVLKGPARSPLQHYAVALCNGHLYVDSSTSVDASTRTAA